MQLELFGRFFCMSKCAFCADSGAAGQTAGFYLCARCRDQLCALRPEDPRYFWYARAVRRALMPSAGESMALTEKCGAR